MISEISLMAELKSSTWPLHKEIESYMPFFNEGFDSVQYQDLLEKFFSFYQAYEQRLQEVLPQTSLVEFYQGRQKTPALVKDLHALRGARVDSPLDAPQKAELPSLHSRAAVLGSLYVIEGSTLGGQIITRHLQQKVGLPAEHTHFFSGYGTQTGPRWKEFQQLMDSQNFTTAERAEAIESAKATFISLMKWIF